MRRLLITVTLTALSSGACGFEELVDYVNDAGGNTDLTGHSDPSVQAAGVSDDVVEEEKAAQEHVGRALDSNRTDQQRVEDIRRAVERRPLDPTYRLHQIYVRRFIDPSYYNIHGGSYEEDSRVFSYLLDDLYPLPEGEQARLEALLPVTQQWLEHLRSQYPSLEQAPQIFYDQQREYFCSARDFFNDEYGETPSGAQVSAALRSDKITCPQASSGS